MPVWGHMHRREMDRCDTEGPPELNLAPKAFVLLRRLKMELWCQKVPKKQ